MPATLNALTARPARASGREAFARAVLGALSGSGGSFSVEVPSSIDVTAMATKLRLWLLVTRAATGGASATVSPEFLKDTYPAMLDLARSLDHAGLKGVWAAEDERTFRVGKARHVFVSVDRPLSGPGGETSRPDTLLEVVSAGRIDRDWFRTRVCPRAAIERLTTVVYGAPREGAVFAQVRAKNLLAEWKDGVCRHFSLDAAVAEAVPQLAGDLR